ncbi:MAG: hypothetical protein HY914_06610 [Desulfomonile tiedjei]|nr:hypothetical protein [Desulfomonile tiedjei]
MAFDLDVVEKLDGLYDRGREFIEEPRLHGASAEYTFEVCAFDEWRRKVNDLLYSLGGCEDLYYQRFSKEVTRPFVRDLEEGLRIISAVRDDVACSLKQAAAGGGSERATCGRPSVSFH